jgi:hypothetical protein
MTAADRGHAPPAVTRLPAEDIRRLDPYGFLAVLGKRVIRPGGRRSTQQLLELASLAAGQQVLDIGCRVATTIQVAQWFNAQVTAPTWPRSCWPAPTATPILPTAVPVGADRRKSRVLAARQTRRPESNRPRRPPPGTAAT